MPRKQIRTSKSVLEYIFWLLLITALVIWSIWAEIVFCMEMKNGSSKKFIIWVILRHCNGSRMKFYLTPIIPGGYSDSNWRENDYNRACFDMFEQILPIIMFFYVIIAIWEWELYSTFQVNYMINIVFLVYNL